MKSPRINNRISSLLRSGVLLAVLSFGISAQTANDAVTLEPPAKGLVAVDFPDLSNLEPSVSEQLQAVRGALMTEAQSKNTTNERLGNAYAQTAMMFHAYSFPETARQSYLNAAVLLPKDFRWRHLLGTVLIDLQMPLEAVEQFKLSAKLKPDYLATYLHSGEALLGINSLELARVAFTLAAEKAPESPAVLFGLGRLEYAEKNFLAAAAHFEKVLELVPAANRVHYTLALAYRNLNEPEKARLHMQQQGPFGIAVADPLLEDIEQMRSGNRSKMIAAKTALDGKMYEAAIKIYSELLDTEPENITALVNISAAFVGVKKYTEAVGMLERAVKVAPDNTNAHFNLGVLYSNTKKPFQAIGSFKTVLKLRPDDVETRYLLAKELKASELADEALKEFRTVIDQNPNNEEALIDLVGLLAGKGLDSEVMERLSHAYSLFPTRTWTAAAYAFALAQSPVKELRDGEKALELSQKVYAATRMTEHGFLVVLSLAELGRCENAINLGTKFVEKAKQEKQELLAANLKAQVEGFKNGGCIASDK